MATINLVQGKFESYLDTGALNNAGTVGIYEPDGTYSTLKTHYNSSSLSTPNANPLTLDSAGRGTIYFTGDADIRVKDSIGNIIYSQRNVSPQTVVSVVALTGNTTIGASHYSQFIQVSGTGVTLTLTDAGTLTSGWYTDIVNTDSINTVTIARATSGDTINGTAANISLLPYQAIQIFANASANGFIITSKRTHSKEYKQEAVQTMNASSLWMAEGADVASASDCNIWTTDGNTVHITGTTTITDWGTAPQAGATKMVIFDGALQLTYNATTNKLNTGGSNYTTEAGDRALVYADTTASYIVTIFSVSGNNLPAVTRVSGDNTTNIANTSFVHKSITGFNPIMGTQLFGATSMPQNVTRYIGEPGAALAATESVVDFYVTTPFSARDLILSSDALLPAGQTATATIRKNGADTAVTISVTDAVSVNRDSTHTVSFSPGDKFSMKLVTSPTTGTRNYSLSCRFVDPANGEGVSQIPFNVVGDGVTAYLNYGGLNSYTLDTNESVLMYYPIAVSNAYITEYFEQSTSSSLLDACSRINVNGSLSISPPLGAAGAPVANSPFALGNPGAQVRSNFLPKTVGLVQNGFFLVRSGQTPTTARSSGAMILAKKESTCYSPFKPIFLSSINQAQGTTRYMSGHGQTGETVESIVQFPLMAGTVSNFILYNCGTGVAGQTWTLNIRKNGTTVLPLTLSGTTTVVTDLLTTITFSNNDKISAELISSATTGTRTIQFAFDHYSA